VQTSFANPLLAAANDDDDDDGDDDDGDGERSPSFNSLSVAADTSARSATPGLALDLD
jgi:hypothetical protein